MNTETVHQAEIIPTNQAIARQPMTGLEVTVSAALEAQVRAGIEARYTLAIRQPRDVDAFRLRLLKECKRPRFAEVARYSKPQGGTKIEGPSIRFVEAALRCYTNIFPEVSVVYDDPTKRVMRVSVTDLEANVTYNQDVTINKTVERSNKDGREVLGVRQNTSKRTVYIVAATDDEILIKQNSLLSKTLRTLGLRVLPGDIVDEAQDLILETQKQEDDADPDAQRKRLFDGFAEIGIMPDEIKTYLGREVGNADMRHLRALFQAVRAGEVNWGEVLAEKRAGEDGAANKGLTEKLKNKAEAAKPETPKAPTIDPAEIERWKAELQTAAGDENALREVHANAQKSIGKVPEVDNLYLKLSAQAREPKQS